MPGSLPRNDRTLTAPQAGGILRRAMAIYPPRPSSYKEALPVHVGPPRSPEQATRPAGPARSPSSSPCFHSSR